MFFCILTQIVPHPTGGKVDAALPSSTTFCYSAFAVVLSVQRFLNLVPTEACRMVPNCELETGIVQCYVCCFNPRYTCSKTKFKYKYHVLEV